MTRDFADLEPCYFPSSSFLDVMRMNKNEYFYINYRFFFFSIYGKNISRMTKYNKTRIQAFKRFVD